MIERLIDSPMPSPPGGVERFEHARRLGLAEADAGILDGADPPGAIVTVVGGRADDHPTPHRRDLPHRLGGKQQIEEDVLELTCGRSGAKGVCRRMPCRSISAPTRGS